jgi:hypothetical protein
MKEYVEKYHLHVKNTKYRLNSNLEKISSSIGLEGCREKKR